MTATTIIKVILKLVHESDFVRAVETWRSHSAEQGKCGTCFYESLPQTIRCATCLDGHVSAAELYRAYDNIELDDLTRARQNLNHWLKS